MQAFIPVACSAPACFGLQFSCTCLNKDACTDVLNATLGVHLLRQGYGIFLGSKSCCHVAKHAIIVLVNWQLHSLISVTFCRSTNTSPGAGGPGHTSTMARSASMALAAQAAAAASLRRHTPLTPVSPPSPSHTTHDYTPGSFTYSGSMSATPEALMSRRAELDGTEPLSAGEHCLSILLMVLCIIITIDAGVLAAFF